MNCSLCSKLVCENYAPVGICQDCCLTKCMTCKSQITSTVSQGNVSYNHRAGLGLETKNYSFSANFVYMSKCDICCGKQVRRNGYS
jgi:hypothetical protein